MEPTTAERRRFARMATACSAVLYDRRGRVLAKGRTGDTSEGGLFLLASARRAPRQDSQAIVEIAVPKPSRRQSERNAARTVRYLARVAHVEQLGQMYGIGLAFLKKLA